MRKFNKYFKDKKKTKYKNLEVKSQIFKKYYFKQRFKLYQKLLKKY